MNLSSSPPCSVSSLTVLNLKDNATDGVPLERGMDVTGVLDGFLAERKTIQCEPCPNVTTSMTSSNGLGAELMPSGCVQFYSTEVAIQHEQDEGLRYWALVLLLFPVVTLFGNVLVCVSVLVERSLHTVTNYFIVSLAVADIMVALLVMPLAIYVEVNNTKWQLGDALCDTWVAFDVLCCTASILNLTAISIDRFVAVTSPIRYNKHKNSTGVYAMLVAVTWIISICISSPIALGENYTKRRQDTPDLCTFYNSDFLIYSSMGSFYIPCIVMLALYWKMFRSIRQMARRSLMRRQSCFDSTDLDGNRSRIPPPRCSPYSSPVASRRDTVDDQFCAPTYERNGSISVGGSGVTASLLVAPCGGGARHLSIDDNITSRFEVNLDLDGCQQAEEPLLTPTNGDSPMSRLYINDDSGKTYRDSRNSSPMPDELEGCDKSGREEKGIWNDYGSSERAEGSDISVSRSRHLSTIRENDDRQRSLSLVIDEPVSGDEYNSYQPRLSTNSFEMSPVSLLPTRSRTVSEETECVGAKRRRPPVILFDMSDVPTRASLSLTEVEVQQRCDAEHLAGADGDVDTDGQRRWSAASSRPAGEHLLRTARKSISKINVYLSSRLPAVGGLMCGRRDRSATKRERKATKTLAIVLAVFLICWVPFFTVNIVNAVCIRYEACDDEEQAADFKAMMLTDGQGQTQYQSQDQSRSGKCQTSVCHIDPLLLSCFVWLGYINSALNPVIYTIFNAEFRQVFKRLLSRRSSITLLS